MVKIVAVITLRIYNLPGAQLNGMIRHDFIKSHGTEAATKEQSLISSINLLS